jgi:sulfur-oxidizing protein SoxY
MKNRRKFFKMCLFALNVSVIGAMGANVSWAADAPLNKVVNSPANMPTDLPTTKAASEAKDAASVLIALGVQNAGPGKRILLDVPEIVNEKESIAIKVKSAIPNTDWIAVLIDKNPFPFVGQFDLTGTKAATIEISAKLAQTSSIVAVVRADGKYYRVDKEVKVAIVGGCE